MDRKYKIGLVVVTVVVSFAVGRYTVPVKTVVETKVVEVEKKVVNTDTNTDQNKHKETTVTEMDKPDGTKVIVTKTDEVSDIDTKINSVSTLDKKTDKSEAKTSVKSGGGVSVSALAGLSAKDIQSYVYGIHASKEVLGPIS